MDKISIAACDDSPLFLKELERELRPIFEAENMSADISLFDKASDVDAALAAGAYFDIYFIDIEMPGVDGIELGHIIRDKYRQHEPLVFYISLHTQYYAELFSVHPFDFILKPIEKDHPEFRTKVLKAIEQIRHERDMFEYKDGKVTVYIRKSRILYLESDGRDIILTYQNGSRISETVYSGALRDELAQLRPPYFAHPHVSFIVNFNHCFRIMNHEIEMTNGRRIPVSRDKYKETKRAFMLYLGR